jgi:hypothetical protein
LAATTLALAAYVALLSWAYVDAAKALPSSPGVEHSSLGTPSP